MWRSLGVSRRDRALALVGPSLLADRRRRGRGHRGRVGGRRASVRSPAHDAVDSGSGPALSADVALVAVAVLLATAALTAWRATLVTARSAGRSTLPRRAPLPVAAVRRARWVCAPPVEEAARSRSSRARTVAVLTVAATLVFTASLVRFLDRPDRFGWPYDVAAVVNAGYDNPNLEAIAATLDDPGLGRRALGSGGAVGRNPGERLDRAPRRRARRVRGGGRARRSSRAGCPAATTRSRSASSPPTSSASTSATRSRSPRTTAHGPARSPGSSCCPRSVRSSPTGHRSAPGCSCRRRSWTRWPRARLRRSACRGRRSPTAWARSSSSTSLTASIPTRGSATTRRR